jgi:hypothetical protein
MRGWYRIGVVLSVLWFISFGLGLWIRLLNKDLDTGHCSLMREIEQKRLDNLVGPDWAARFRKAEEDEKACRDSVHVRVDNNWNFYWVAAFAAAAISVALLWLVVLITVAVARWIVAGFRRANP